MTASGHHGVDRVAFLSSEYPPHTYGGLGASVEALSRFLARDRLEVSLLVPAASDYAEPPPGVSLHPVPVRGAVSDEDYWLTYCESAVETVQRTGLRVDLVHCHDWMTALGGLAIGAATGAPVLMSVHLPQSTVPNLVLENIGIAGSDGVLVNSEAVRAELTVREVGNGLISVIPNGVDLAQFPPGDEAPDADQILFVGRLVPQKGVDVLIRAFGAVLRLRPAARLVIAGDGPQRLYLERLARFLGLRHRVSFLGWQSRSDLAELYREAAVTCVPSLYEPFGLVALEAMASSRPVVVGRVGGLAEIVNDESSGYLVEAGDHLDLATRLAALLSDPPLARAKGIAARRRAEQFDWAIMAARTVELYDSLASTAARGTPPGTIDQVLATADVDVRRRASALLASVPSFRAEPAPVDTRDRRGAR
jgi:glycosyltransferase involved in cell wall biosynthesis